jgi:hypothetical protein
MHANRPHHEKRRVENNDHQPQFGWSKADERQPKPAGDMIGQNDKEAKQQIADQGEKRGPHSDVWRKPEAYRDHDNAYRVHRVVDKETIAMPFGVAIARQRPVERISEPVDDEAEAGEKKKDWIPIAGCISDRRECGAKNQSLSVCPGSPNVAAGGRANPAASVRCPRARSSGSAMAGEKRQIPPQNPSAQRAYSNWPLSWFAPSARLHATLDCC